VKQFIGCSWYKGIARAVNAQSNSDVLCCRTDPEGDQLHSWTPLKWCKLPFPAFFSVQVMFIK